MFISFQWNATLKIPVGKTDPAELSIVIKIKTDPVYYTSMRNPFRFLWLLKYALIDHLRVPSIPDSAGEKTKLSPQLCDDGK